MVIKDFSKYNEKQLRALVIQNALDETVDRQRVYKKYNNCDRDMLLWFIEHTYGGQLIAPDIGRTVTETKAQLEIDKWKKPVRPVVRKHVKFTAPSGDIGCTMSIEVAPGVMSALCSKCLCGCKPPKGWLVI
jgi:hypothetical protein